MYQIILISLSYSLFVLNVCCSLTTIRRTFNGPVEGTEETSVLGQQYYSFKGIPFAEPPITGRDPYTGELVDRRFKAPEPLHRRWTDPFKVQNFSKLCMISHPMPANFSYDYFDEDCLYLDVYVPAGGSCEKNVLVYIHGAGADGGVVSDKTLLPDFLIHQDNIVVQLAYRVQTYGFLNLGIGEYSGNMALKDQQLGIKWVYENIENFSGNKNAIMLFGQSNGGSFVNYHMVNEVSRKYFTRAYCMSGTTQNPFYNLRKKNHLQEAKKCFGLNDTDKLIEFMKTTVHSSFIDCYAVYAKFLEPIWAPSVEYPNAPAAFLTTTPDKIYNSDKPPALDALFSTTNAEGIHFTPIIATLPVPITHADHTYALQFNGFFEDTYPKEYAQAIDILDNAYFTSSLLDVDAIRNENIAFQSDNLLHYSILKNVMLQANANNNNCSTKIGNKNTFLLRFSAHTDINPFEVTSHIKYTVATHSDDLCYIFYCQRQAQVYEQHLECKDSVYDMIMRMVKIITNFARTGDPTIDSCTPFQNCKSSDEIYCTDISNDLQSFVINDIKEQFNFNTWLEVENIYYSLNQTQDKCEYVQEDPEAKINPKNSQIKNILQNLCAKLSLK